MWDAEQRQNTEEPPMGGPAGNAAAEGELRLVQDRVVWEQRGLGKLPCLHHRHPENKYKQRDPPFKNHLPSHPRKDIAQCQVEAKQQPIWAPG